jgi:hypothetical protein
MLSYILNHYNKGNIMNIYTPDCWVFVRIETAEHGVIDKILAGWCGGFTTGDSWKLSSGVEKIEEFENRYEYTNFTGSLYICHKDRERFSNYLSSIFGSFLHDVEQYKTAHPDKTPPRISRVVIKSNTNDDDPFR